MKPTAGVCIRQALHITPLLYFKLFLPCSQSVDCTAVVGFMLISFGRHQLRNGYLSLTLCSSETPVTVWVLGVSRMGKLCPGCSVPQHQCDLQWGISMTLNHTLQWLKARTRRKRVKDLTFVLFLSFGLAHN